MKSLYLFVTIVLFAFVNPYKHKQQFNIPFLKNNLYGYSDTNNNILFEPKFAWLDFYDTLGYARFKIINNEYAPYGLLDKNFNPILKPIYRNIQTYSHFIVVSDTSEFGNKQLLNSKGELLLKKSYSNIVVANNFVKCVYQNTDHELYRFNFSSQKLEHLQTVKKGNALFYYNSKNQVEFIYYYDKDFIYNALDTLGKKIEKPLPEKKYDHSGKVYKEDYSIITTYASANKKDKKGIEIKNNITNKKDTLSPIYSYLKIIYDYENKPYFILKIKKLYGLMDVHKKWVLKPEYDSIAKIESDEIKGCNLILKTYKNSRWRLFFENLKHDEKTNSFHQLDYFENNYFVSDIGAKKGVISIFNNKITPIIKNQFLEIHQIHYLPNGKSLFKVEDFQNKIYWTDGFKSFKN